MDIITGTPQSLNADVMSGLARYRYRVFIEQLGWPMPCADGQELDEFDTPSTTYLLARNEQGQTVGTARLLPTTQPYLLAEVFPQLMGGLPLPRSDTVWELSRFAAVDLEAAQGHALSAFSSPVAVELLQQAIRSASDHGAERLITVSPIGVERLLRRAGFKAHRAAPPVLVDQAPLFACWIECT
jgi:acyl homoserine lactone synthase